MENKKLWDEIKVTDPCSVKPITGKAYKGNSPKPYWLIERMTDTFGPVGIGWGVIVKSERFERMSDTDVLHVAVVSVWYVRDGVRSDTFDQMGGTKAAYMTSSGKLMIDDDAGKKSVTDGMVKCMSMIGLCADIFSGRWDDDKYVEWAAQQYAPESPKPPMLDEKQIANVQALLTETNADKDAFFKWISTATGQQVTSLADTPAEAYNPIVKRLEAKKEKSA